MALDLETREQLLGQVRRFVEDVCVPNEQRVSETNSMPDEIVAQMKDMGLFGLSIAEEYGGLGLNLEEEALVVLEMGHTSPAFRSTFGTNVGIGSQGIVMFGNADQKNEWLPKLASGEAIASFALTEPESGSDAGSAKTRAVRDGNHYVLNGAKRFITTADKASVFTVMARTDPSTPGAKGLSAFIVERDTKGITVGKPEKKMGQQGANVCDVIFEDARVPITNRLGEEGDGMKVAMSVLDRGRFHISALSVGIAERLVQEMTRYASERKQFGKPIIEHQLVMAMIADSYAEAAAGRAMVLDGVRKYDRKEKVTLLAAATKMWCTEMVGRVADRAVQVHGGAGYIADYAVERFYRDVRILRLYEGTTQIQQMVIGRELQRMAKAGEI
ncbi:MAG TPA: acyl-CoA dehydrogenase family protein [Hyphomonadaceae bacterium]|nr:acyl-CoA dehydrogenase family protein [Hyphomonadaceae bacterium]